MEATVVAHRMDPARKELYVEGIRDRCFLKWTFGDAMHPCAVIKEIASVDIGVSVAGGERGRLMAFAEWIEGKSANIRFLADADMDRVLGRTVPSRGWLTDHRDLEGYVLAIPCLTKVLSMGLATDLLSARALLDSVQAHGRILGLLRILSEKESLHLPFQNTQLSRFVDANGKGLSVRFDGYIRALVQNANISLGELPDIRARLEMLKESSKHIPDFELIHGKDAFCLIAKALSRFKIGNDEVERLLWTSFEKSLVPAHPTLMAVSTFLA